MPVQSMTGFGKGEVEGENYTLSVEIKTVNNRFKEVRFKMSSLFNALELPLKKKIESFFKRGTFDIYVSYKKAPSAQKSNDLDMEKIKNYVQEIQKVATATNTTLQLNPTEFMKNDFYVEDDSKSEELQELLLKAFDGALEDLSSSRAEEGKKLLEKLEEHKANYLKHYKKVDELKHSYQDQVKEKLLKKFDANNADLKMDESRFQQEVIYYMEKLDIDEEINRIDIHLGKLAKLLTTTDGEIGRQIDFLVQELNRETNTIGSKSGSGEISENVVQMKVQLEKIREQALNIE
jgi:uncharacterized protein (TIGR00255 family)